MFLPLSTSTFTYFLVLQSLSIICPVCRRRSHLLWVCFCSKSRLVLFRWTSVLPLRLPISSLLHTILLWWWFLFLNISFFLVPIFFLISSLISSLVHFLTSLTSLISLTSLTSVIFRQECFFEEVQRSCWIVVIHCEMMLLSLIPPSPLHQSQASLWLFECWVWSPVSWYRQKLSDNLSTFHQFVLTIQQMVVTKQIEIDAEQFLSAFVVFEGVFFHSQLSHHDFALGFGVSEDAEHFVWVFWGLLISLIWFVNLAFIIKLLWILRLCNSKLTEPKIQTQEGLRDYCGFLEILWYCFLWLWIWYEFVVSVVFGLKIQKPATKLNPKTYNLIWEGKKDIINVIIVIDMYWVGLYII